MADPNKGRIAIKFGGPSSTSKSSRPPPPPPQALGKRSRAALGDNGDSDSDGGAPSGHHEAITGFDAGGAETAARKARATEKKKVYVIARQPNRDWRSEMRPQRRGGDSLLPEEERQRRNGNGVVEREDPQDEEKPLQWGLTIKKKEENGIKQEEDEEAPTAGMSAAESPVKKEENEEDDKKPLTRSADDEAMDALLGRGPKDQVQQIIQPSETDAFRRDVEAAGEASTLADYEAMPVEEFGAALLRGMGWDGKERGTMRHKQVKRRPNRLGLGAKELKETEDLGGWNQGGGKKRSRPRLDEYRREESKRKEGKTREDSYIRERERERESDRRDKHRGSHRGDKHRGSHRDRDRDYEGRRDRHRDYDRDRRR